jgi:hypothetical protein
MSKTHTADDPLDEQSVTGTIENADVKWVDDDEYDSRSVTVDLLANGWIRLPMEGGADEYYPPNEVIIVTHEDTPEETTQPTE